jgi:hypothetical protein
MISKNKHKPKKQDVSVLKNYLSSVWLFPLILLIALITLTATKISGTSMGIYHPIFYGGAKDSSLLLNKPLPIRSDEWLVTSQLTIAQHAAGYPRFNTNIDTGRDMSLVGDAPYKDWSSLFKPQNLAFLMMPLEYAFAFKWWLLLFLTIIGCYFLVLRMLPGRIGIAILLSLAFSCSPFLFWWYTSGTFAPIFYGFFIVILGLRIINDEKIVFLRKYRNLYSQLAYATLLGYLLTCFALVLYPPFQIPVAITVAALLAGFFLDKYPNRKLLFSKNSIRKLLVFFLSALIASITVWIFIQTRSTAVDAITKTSYPGHRIVSSGHTPAYQLFATYLQPQLERDDRGSYYFGNQSEASNFILLLPFLLLPGFALLLKEYRQGRGINWPLLAIQLCIVLFLLNMFVAGFQPLYKLLLLDQVPHARLWIGLGFAGFIQLLLVVKSVNTLKAKNRAYDFLVGGYSVMCLLALLWAGLHVRAQYPKFISNLALILGLSLVFSFMVFCFLSRRLLIGASIFMIFCIVSIYKIHPLYHGLGPLGNNKLFETIQTVSKPADTWVTADNIQFENFALMSNRDSLSGVKPYPNLGFWRQVDGPSSDYIYNRYAHVIFLSSPPSDTPLHLVHSDFFEVEFSCSNFITSNVDFVLDTAPIQSSCLTLKDKVVYPGATFYIYKVQ